jgi:uncharacterized protein YecE (DUF72 family)
LAEALGARFILFQTPASFYPNADHLRDMYRFFKGIRRQGRAALVWEPRGTWDESLVTKVCGDLGLLRGADPEGPRVRAGAVAYYRLHGRLEGGRVRYGNGYSDAELRALLELCGAGPAYVYFNTSTMWKDAGRFLALCRPEEAALERASRRRRCADW